jgi:hypothetical protein
LIVNKKEINYKHIFGLIALAIIMKIVVAVLTVYVFKSVMDPFDMSYYYDHVQMMFQGKIPYVDVAFEYPALSFIPMIIAYGISTLFGKGAYYFSFQCLMTLCDIGIVICIYLITLKLWDNKKALYASILYATSISVAYFNLVRFDAYPSLLVMIALTYVIYNKNIGDKTMSYCALIIGFWVKLYPIVVLPFTLLYNWKDEISKKNDIIKIVKIFSVMGIILFVPFLILNYQSIINTYSFIRPDTIDNATSFSFMVYSWFHDVCGISVALNVIQYIFIGVMVIGVGSCLYYLYKLKEKDPIILLKLIVCSFVLIYMSAKVKSPQYALWFMPMVCILAVDDIRKIIMVYIMQIIMFIEFPVMLGILYMTFQYHPPALSYEWYLALIFFTIEFIVVASCIGLIVFSKPVREKIEELKIVKSKKRGKHQR